MTRILEQAIEEAKRLPDERQDELGEMILSVVEQDASDVRLSADQVEEVRRRIAEPQELVPDDEMKAFFRNLTK